MKPSAGSPETSPATVRLMMRPEADLIIDYFTSATSEYLENLGVDPTRLPTVAAWGQHYDREFDLPVERRPSLALIWLDGDQPVGFSTADKIVFGQRANMHLHLFQPDNRARGLGAACVRQSVDLFFTTLQLKQLFCEPNAFNVAPNRALQKAGFKYLKTHWTVPSPINFHQAVTRWVVER
jgi:RimJ/RimL family protein N-acetyltransferase